MKINALPPVTKVYVQPVWTAAK